MINLNFIKFLMEKVVNDYVVKGVVLGKIVLGLLFYGRGFEVMSGLGRLYNGIGEGLV